MDPSALPVLAGLVAAALAIISWQAVRHRVARRFALRDAVRRPGETALVVAGSLLGTALITGSFIVGDTLDSSIRASAVTQLGPIDEIVVADRARAGEIEARIAGLGDRRIDGVGSFVAVEAAIASRGSGERRAQPGGQIIELDFGDMTSFGGDAAATGIAGPAPARGEAVITQALADEIEAGRGDRITAYLYGTALKLEVARVIPQLGVAGYWPLFGGDVSYNALVAPGTIAALTRDGIPHGAVPPQTTIAISNRGGVEEGAELTEEVVPLVEKAVGAGAGLRVEPEKQELLEVAEEEGKSFTELFLGIGSFAIIAAVLLLVNIFVMLAEERKSQLGMLRAVGMRRAVLVRTFVIEGAIYALLAGALGAMVGIAVGWVIVTIVSGIFTSAAAFSLSLTFTAAPASVVGGFCFGVLISLLTVTLTSWRITRINIIRAIRDVTEPVRAHPGRRAVIAGAVVAALAGAWFVAAASDRDAWLPAIAAPPIVAFGLVPLAARMAGRRKVVLASAGLSLLWGIFGNALLDGRFFDSGEIFAFVVQGVLLSFSAVVLLSQSHETFGGGLRRLAATHLPLRIGLAYPLARKFRTGLTLGMYALVIFTMVFLASMADMFSAQIDRATAMESGGFDLVATSNESNPPRAKDIAAVEDVRDLSVQLRAGALFAPDGYDKPEPWAVTGVGSDFVRAGPVDLEERAAGLQSDDEVWDRLLADPKTMIVDNFFLQGGGGPPAVAARVGDTVTVIDPITGAGTTRKVIGISSTDNAFAGTYMSRRSVRAALSRSAPSRFYVRVATGADAGEIARRLQGRFVANGLEAKAFRRLVEENLSLSLQFLRLMQGYLALGLIVGIAGLGVVMVRAVRERRRAIGVLRSLGFLSAQVRRSFLLESGFVALEGIVVGSVLALVTASQLVANGDFGEGLVFAIPWVYITALGVAALAASLLATAWPAQQAARIPPAVALRAAE